MSRKKMFNEAQVQKMKDAYLLGGATLQKIAVDFAVSVPTISKYLTDAGVEIRPRGRRPGYKAPPKVDAGVHMPAPTDEELTKLIEDDPNPEEPDVAQSDPEPGSLFRFNT